MKPKHYAKHEAKLSAARKRVRELDLIDGGDRGILQFRWTLAYMTPGCAAVAGQSQHNVETRSAIR